MSQTKWREILSVLRWHLELRIGQYQQALECQNADFIRRMRALLKESYEMNRFLRRHLGYYKKTKVEQEAESLLEL